LRWKAGFDRELHQLAARTISPRPRNDDDLFHDLVRIFHRDPESRIPVRGSDLGSYDSARRGPGTTGGIPEQGQARAASTVE
jgi:hypothetical protein